MRRIAIGMGALGLVAVLGVTWAADRDDATCSTSVEFRGTTYIPWETSDEVLSGNDLGTGTERGCGDKGSYSLAISMSETPEVSSRLVLASPTEARTLWLAEGVTPLDLPAAIADNLFQQRP
jgi:hypothetical protein